MAAVAGDLRAPFVASGPRRGPHVEHVERREPTTGPQVRIHHTAKMETQNATAGTLALFAASVPPTAEVSYDIAGTGIVTFMATWVEVGSNG